MTVRAYKGKEGPCLERKQAVVYKGPWKQVRDDDGHTLRRGEWMAVCDKTYNLMTDPNGPYAGHVLGIQPEELVSLDDAPAFNCNTNASRHPREVKGADYDATTQASDCCEPGSGESCC